MTDRILAGGIRVATRRSPGALSDVDLHRSRLRRRACGLSRQSLRGRRGPARRCRACDVRCPCDRRLGSGLGRRRSAAACDLHDLLRFADGPLDRAAWRRACDVVERHESLAPYSGPSRVPRQEILRVAAGLPVRLRRERSLPRASSAARRSLIWRLSAASGAALCLARPRQANPTCALCCCIPCRRRLSFRLLRRWSYVRGAGRAGGRAVLPVQYATTPVAADGLGDECERRSRCRGSFRLEPRLLGLPEQLSCRRPRSCVAIYRAMRSVELSAALQVRCLKFRAAGSLFRCCRLALRRCEPLGGVTDIAIGSPIAGRTDVALAIVGSSHTLLLLTDTSGQRASGVSPGAVRQSGAYSTRMFRLSGVGCSTRRGRCRGTAVHVILRSRQRCGPSLA